MVLKDRYSAIFEGKKPLREKEKMLVTSIFSFSHKVFRRLLIEGVYSRDGLIRAKPNLVRTLDKTERISVFIQ